MLVVVDSNKLQSEELEIFLKKSPSNKAVLTDFVAIEAYKGNTLVGIYKALEVVARFPKQVVILKNSVQALRQSGRVKSLQRRLIDHNQTVGFSKYLRALEYARNGDMMIQKEIFEKSRDATEHLSVMLEEAEEMKETIMALGNEYTKEERKIIRERGTYTEDMRTRLISTILEVSSFIFAKQYNMRKRPAASEVRNTFAFRYSLACYLLVIRRNAEGGITNSLPKTLRNDFVDMGIVAYATFFDGLLSADARLVETFNDVCAFMYAIGAFVPAVK